MNSKDKSIVFTANEAVEASLRFPNMPVHEALELNRSLRENVADAMSEAK